MACFLVPMVLAILMSALQKASRSLAERLKLALLNMMLWGGTVLLAIEHMWHGEVVPWPPFLTAMANPVNVPMMVSEMLTVGTTISLVTVAVWGIILAVNRYISSLKIGIASIRSIEQKLS